MGKRGNGEGSIWRDSRGFYRASVSMDDGKRRFYSGKTREQVREKLHEALAAQNKHLPLPGVKLLTAKYLNDWLEESVKPSRKPLTYEKYRGIVDNHIIPVIGKVPLSRVGPEHVRKIQNRLIDQDLSAGTIHGVRSTLGAALTLAEKWNLVARNAVRLVDPPAVEAKEPRVLQPEEASAFLRAATGHAMNNLFATMLATGLRPGEARGLRWADVTLDGPSPVVQVRQQVLELRDEKTERSKRQPRKRVFGSPKSEHGRRAIPLIPMAVSALQAQKHEVAELPVRGLRDLVFPTETGEPLTARTVRDHFHRIATSAGIANATPHTLRHSTGTFLLAAGVPDRVVQAILGHGSAAMTRHYQHVLPSMLADAGARLAQFLAATS
jgi:integrase